LKKALKIIDRLEESTSLNKSTVEVYKNANRIVYASKINHFLILLISIVLITAPFYLIYSLKNEIGFIRISILVICSLIITLGYFKGTFQTYNDVEVEIGKRRIFVKRKGWLGKLILKDRIVHKLRSNEIIEETIPFTFSFQTRITLKNEGVKIPLFDIGKYDSSFDDILLSLRLLVKDE
jgi:hypothetical protein